MSKIKLLSVLIVFSAFSALMLSSCGKKEPASKPVNEAAKAGHLQASPTSLMAPAESDMAFSNGFVYYGVGSSLIEYDTETGTTATITPKVPDNAFVSDCSLYDGYIYAVEMLYNSADNSEAYSIIRIDYNTGDTEEIYSPDDSADAIDRMTVSSDGKLFFTQGHFVSGDTDENGFSNSYYVCSYDIGTGKAEQLVCADSYYIDNDTIYFTRLSESTDTEHLLYARMSDTSAVTDTQTDVVSSVSENTPYMYFPADGKVYYSVNDNKLRCYDVSKNESTDICTFADETYVRYFQKWDGKMIVLLREHRKNSQWYQYGLYYLDKNNKPVKILDEEYFNKNYPLGFEYIDFMTIFSEYENSIMISTYNLADDRRLYLIGKDLEPEKVIEVGDWDYKTYEEEQLEIEKTMQNADIGGQQ